MNRSIRRPAVVAWILLSLCAAADTPAEESRVVPTERCGDYYLVPMSFGDDADRIVWMLLDTGAAYTVIDPDSLERVSGKRVESGRRVNLPTLKAGELEFSGLSARVRKLDHLQLALGKPMDGILGFPTFRKVLLTIDYPNAEVRIRNGALPQPDGVHVFRTIKEKHRPVIELDFAGYRRQILLDSGAAGGFVLQDSDRLSYVEDPVPFDSSLRIDRVMIRAGARLTEDVLFGGVPLARPTLVVADSTELVGARVMRNFAVTFDQKRRRVFFERSSDAPIAFPPIRDVGWAVTPREDGYEVLRVFEGLGASRAGIQPGDYVTRIDGTPVYERDLCDREPEERDSVPVTLRRDGESIEVDVPVDVVVP